MRAIMRRMEQGEHGWRAEFALRAFGLAVLGLCASAVAWTHGLVSQPPPHAATLLELAGAMLAFACWSVGWACLAEGPGLFRLIWVPTRHWTI